jgi:hypothetical protein
MFERMDKMHLIDSIWCINIQKLCPVVSQISAPTKGIPNIWNLKMDGIVD